MEERIIRAPLDDDGCLDTGASVELRAIGELDGVYVCIPHTNNYGWKIVQHDIDRYGVDPKYLGKQGWYVEALLCTDGVK